MTTGARRVSFCKLEAVTVGVVFAVNRDERWNAKATYLHLANLGTGTLWGEHDDGDVLTHLHAFFNNVEAV